jgi:hypothetical protein
VCGRGGGGSGREKSERGESWSNTEGEREKWTKKISYYVINMIF